ncbi:MAG: hypothetical protein ACFE9N_05495 [Promethearchaeota archaeon]
MAKSELYDIIKMDDIKVSIPQTSHFSIGTSPYYAHQHGLAIDIYHNLTLKNYEVLSPISGKVYKIKTLAAPKPKFPNGLDVDYLILISNPSNSEIIWKIMHIKPFIKVGEKIEEGDLLGETIRNGYFAYWSSPHLHLELRPINDAIRARGGKNLNIAFKKTRFNEESLIELNTERIQVKIHSVHPEMVLAKLPPEFYHRISPIYGIKIMVKNLHCILDGGIPHYKIGTVLLPEEFNLKTLPSIYLGSNNIGTLNEIKGQFGFFKFENIKILLNNREIRGISLYLANFLPLIKIIPYNKNEFSFNSKSTQELSIIHDEKF